MLESDNPKKIPDVEFTFVGEEKSEEERRKEIEELLKKKNEILDSMGIIVSSDPKKGENYPRSEVEKNITGKMKAGIIGFAIGDALGVPVEFLSRSILQITPVKNMIGYGSHKVPEGTWSDDTSLVIATMDSIRELGDVHFEDIMQRFSEWLTRAKYTATNELFDIGVSTRNAIMNFVDGKDAIDCGMKCIKDNGNGSLMRMLPFVYYLYFNSFNEDEKTLLINYASSLTHAHEISELGCKIYTDYITLLLDGVDKIKALELLKNNNYRKYYSKKAVKQYDRILKGNLIELNIDEIKSTGYVVDSLEASLWCTVTNNSFEDAVITAVNLGEDTDTIGAITGSINGIIYGRDAIPERWLNKIRKIDYIEELSDQFINAINCQNKEKKI